MAQKRLVFGTVEEIKGPEAKVNTGHLMPRFLSLNQACDKDHISPRIAGDIVLLVNDQNNDIGYSVFDEKRWNVAINGKLLQSVLAEQMGVIRHLIEGKTHRQEASRRSLL